jgi:hypothetical protein
MSRTALLVLAAIMLASAVSGQTVSITGPSRSELTEGAKYMLTWSAGSAETVNIAITGTRTPLGQQSRGDFLIPIAKGVSAAQGEYSFTQPWIDAISIRVIVNGYAGGKRILSGERTYRFRPAALDGKTPDGIYLDLHARANQRLYTQKDGCITHVYFCSSSEAYLWLPPNRHIAGPHDHAGVFKVLDKSPDHWSELYKVRMLWAMHYLGGHYIHATSPNLYRYLGTPASHGCNRLTRYDAYQLYQMTPIGTRVEVIGPNG